MLLSLQKWICGVSVWAWLCQFKCSNCSLINFLNLKCSHLLKKKVKSHIIAISWENRPPVSLTLLTAGKGYQEKKGALDQSRSREWNRAKFKFPGCYLHVCSIVSHFNSVNLIFPSLELGWDYLFQWVSPHCTLTVSAYSQLWWLPSLHPLQHFQNWLHQGVRHVLRSRLNTTTMVLIHLVATSHTYFQDTHHHAGNLTSWGKRLTLKLPQYSDLVISRVF